MSNVNNIVTTTITTAKKKNLEEKNFIYLMTPMHCPRNNIKFVDTLKRKKKI
jgi:hypothetical protein